MEDQAMMMPPKPVMRRPPGGNPAAPRRQADPSSALHCELGLTRLFGLGDIGRTGLLSGWSSPEDTHQWNDGLDATIALTCDSAPAKLRVTFQGEPYLPPGTTLQPISLYANGYFAAQWHASRHHHAHDDVALSADIEPEWWFLRDGLPLLRLVLHIPGSLSPRDAGAGADGRVLGFCFRTLTLHSPD